MNTTLKYIGYMALSFFVGYCSSLSQSNTDILLKLSGNIIQILITILVAYGTLSNIVLSQLVSYSKDKKKTIQPAIDEMRRSFVCEIFVIVGVFFSFTILNMLEGLYLAQCLLPYKTIIVDSITFFALFYFLYVIVDTTWGLYSIASENCKS